MTDDSKPQGTVQIALRISPDLRERVKAAADANNRSVNSELTATLEEKYPAPDFDWPEVYKRVMELMEAMRGIVLEYHRGMTKDEIQTLDTEYDALKAEYNYLMAQLERDI